MKKKTLGLFEEYDRNNRPTGRTVFLFPHKVEPKKAVDIDGMEYKSLWPGAYSLGFFKFFSVKEATK